MYWTRQRRRRAGPEARAGTRRRERASRERGCRLPRCSASRASAARRHHDAGQRASGSVQGLPGRGVACARRRGAAVRALIRAQSDQRRKNGRPDLRSRTAEIRADWAIVATGYATPEFKPLAGRFRMTNTYVIATSPISAPRNDADRTRAVMLWDTGDPYHYARWTPDKRLLLGGEDEPRDARPRSPRGAEATTRAA